MITCRYYLLFAAAVTSTAACGVSKEFVNQETQTAFDNTVSVAAHVKQKCGADAETDTDCKRSQTGLMAVCQSLDELAKAAGHAGFDCVAWKVKS